MGILAAKNLRENKNILNSISLLTIGISSIIMINTLNYSMNIEVLDAYKNLTYDLQFYVNEMDRRIEQIVKSTPGVTGTYGIYGSYDDIQVKILVKLLVMYKELTSISFQIILILI